VLGSIAAAIGTAALLGAASGLMQLPALQADMGTVKGQMIQVTSAATALDLRVSRREIEIDGIQRQINQIVSRLEQQQVRMDKKDADDRGLDITTQRELQAIEGRSKDRNSQAMGELSAVRTAVQAGEDRLKAQADAVRSLYEIVARDPNQPRPRPQSAPGSTSPLDPLAPPLHRSNTDASVEDGAACRMAQRGPITTPSVMDDTPY
jgi:hypothetical protein